MNRSLLCLILLLCAVLYSARTAAAVVDGFGKLLAAEPESDSPRVIDVSPFPGPVTTLTYVTVTFSKPVQGVDPSDLRVNDVPAMGVSGSGASYTFIFTQPAYGPVQFSWAFDANITDLAAPANAFDISGANATFVFDLVDPSEPHIIRAHPPNGFTVKRLSEIELVFSKGVTGLDAADLLINGTPATNLLGAGAGPYLFQFAAQPDGPLQITWAAEHGIRDENEPPVEFSHGTLNYTVESGKPLPRVRINELVASNVNGLLDQEGSAEDWLELYNPEDYPVPLEGWSLSDDRNDPGQWRFPDVTIGARQFLIVFASAKDTNSGTRPHTNFKLKMAGEYLGLFSPDSPRQAVSELVYPSSGTITPTD